MRERGNEGRGAKREDIHIHREKGRVGEREREKDRQTETVKDKMNRNTYQGRSQEFDLGVYVLTSHCNFKTCVNVPLVNIYHIESVLGHRRRTTTYFKVD